MEVTGEEHVKTSSPLRFSIGNGENKDPPWRTQGTKDRSAIITYNAVTSAGIFRVSEIITFAVSRCDGKKTREGRRGKDKEGGEGV